MKMEVMTTATTWRITMREIIDLNLITLLFLCDEVPHSAYCLDFHLGAFFRELLAQAVNVHLDGVGCDVSRMPEYVIFDLLLGDHPPLAAHQKFKHRGFPGRQHLRLIVDGSLAVLGIELQIGNAKRRTEQ